MNACVRTLDGVAKRLHKNRRWLREWLRDYPRDAQDRPSFGDAGRDWLFTDIELLIVQARFSGTRTSTRTQAPAQVKSNECAPAPGSSGGSLDNLQMPVIVPRTQSYA